MNKQIMGGLLNQRKNICINIGQILCLFLCLVFLFLIASIHRYVFDDAYMFIRYASHLLQGKGYVWNPGGPHTDGLTSPLWMLVVAWSMKVFFIHPNSYESLLYGLSLFFGMVLLVVVFFASKDILSRNEKPLAFLFPIFLLFKPFYFHQHSSNGMETNMAAVLLSLYLWYFIRLSREISSHKKAFLLGFLGFACILSRPEFALITIFSPLIFMFQKSFPPSFKRASNIFFALLVTSLFLALYGIFRWIYFGRIFPCPFFVKGSIWFTPYEDFNKTQRMNLIRLPLNYFKETFLLHLAVFLGLIHQGKCKRLLWLWVPLYLSLLYISTTFQVMGYGYRYYFPFIGAILYLVILLWRREEDSGENTGLRYIYFSFSAFLVLILITAGIYNNFVKRYRNYTAPQKIIIFQMLKRLPSNTSLAATEVGALSAFNPSLIIYDLSGLNDYHFSKGFDADILFDLKPDVISFVHGHYQGIVRQISQHPKFGNYSCLVNINPDNKDVSFTTSIYVDINSPRIKDILESLRYFSDKREIVSSNTHFGFDNETSRIMLDSSGYHPLIGKALGAMKEEGVKDTLTIDVSDPLSPYLGKGWDLAEYRKDYGYIRPLDGFRGNLFLPLDSPSTVTVLMSLYPFEEDYFSPLSLRFLCNGRAMPGNFKLRSGVHLYQLIIPRYCLKKGMNCLAIIPNRSISPREIDPESQDARRLSIGLCSLEYSLIRNWGSDSTLMNVYQ